MDITGWKDERADLIHSTHSAARYLCWMNRIRKVRLDGQPERDGFRDWLLSAAAYNAGPSRVVKLLNTFGARSYWDVPLPAETEKYVPRWIALGLISRYRTYYGVKAEKGPALSFQTVRRLKLRKDLTFRDMARLLDITPRQVWLINTQISPQRAVFPAKWHGRRLLHTINVPMGKKKQFLAQLEAKGYTGK
jgi:membrane-bound lytic murein transglycosylase D